MSINESFGKQEIESQLDLKDSEIIQPNDVVGWYERIYGATNGDYSKLYETDPLDEGEILKQRKSIFNDHNNTVKNTTSLNNNETTFKEEFTFNFDRFQLSEEERTPKNPNYDGKYFWFQSLDMLLNNKSSDINYELVIKDDLKCDDEILSEQNNSEQHVNKSHEIFANNDLDLQMYSYEENNISRRWSRCIDRKAFKFLNKELAKIHMNVDQFLFDSSISVIDGIHKRIEWKLRLSIIKRIIKRFGWHKTAYLLFKRFRKLALNQTFSFRELRLLKRIQLIKFLF